MISSYSYDVEFSNQLCLYVRANKRAERIVFIPVFFFILKFYYLTNLKCKLNYNEHFY